VLRSATEEEVKTLFSRFGKVYDVNLFRAFQGAPTTKVGTWQGNDKQVQLRVWYQVPVVTV
jgi:hypothetical protein